MSLMQALTLQNGQPAEYRFLGAEGWFVEYLPFFTAAQVQAAQADSCSSALPSGTDLKHELFRGVQRHHASVAALQGER